jgi:hypothetical protein
MKKCSFNTSLSFIGIVAFLLWLAFMAVITNVTAQQQCQNPPTQGQNTAWRSGATVTVNIDPTFNAQQRQAIQTAFTNWANAGGSGVTFTFTFNSTPASGANTHQVNNQAPSCGSTCQAETGGTTSGGNRHSAFTNIVLT